MVKVGWLNTWWKEAEFGKQPSAMAVIRIEGTRETANRGKAGAAQDPKGKGKAHAGPNEKPLATRREAIKALGEWVAAVKTIAGMELRPKGSKKDMAVTLLINRAPYCSFCNGIGHAKRFCPWNESLAEETLGWKVITAPKPPPTKARDGGAPNSGPRMNPPAQSARQGLNHPQASGNKPASSGNKPTIGGNKPAISGNKPTNANANKPSAPVKSVQPVQLVVAANPPASTSNAPAPQEVLNASSETAPDTEGSKKKRRKKNKKGQVEVTE